MSPAGTRLLEQTSLYRPSPYHPLLKPGRAVITVHTGSPAPQALGKERMNRLLGPLGVSPGWWVWLSAGWVHPAFPRESLCGYPKADFATKRWRELRGHWGWWQSSHKELGVLCFVRVLYMCPHFFICFDSVLSSFFSFLTSLLLFFNSRICSSTVFFLLVSLKF